ncbi:uncharacterized protein A1O9_06931 [Exophiala aquamarina CBS 119918]|uniref:Oxidoreductase n=1 Tax=Exophiala aquamarina CBS 119918 TaxID=1182545 RepID=A0A072PA64_9EURO|nr:uncharacterized protein A1O9_06931 [Exophiala aquamarina CBS 119918]KEF56741.1 hypothetical protein A1O9_06931 [Exophiala aquamarina CBS 119918]
MASLAGKVITLTGAGSGIGAATAKILASRGAFLALADVNKTALNQVADIIRAQVSTSISTTVVDIRDRAQVKDWIKKTTEKWGPLDGAANVAGVAGKVQNVSHIWEISTEDYDFIHDVNAKGLFHCLAEQLVPGVMKDGSSIASVTSLCGLRGLPRSSVYCSSKHAATGLIKAAAMEAGARQIRVNGIAPGIIQTPMLAQSLETDDSKAQDIFTPIARYGKPEEVGYTLSFLLSDESKFTSGAIYTVDGGWSA